VTGVPCRRGIVERLLPGGEALVRCAEGACLVAHAVPGDHIDFALTDRRRGALRGRISEIRTPSDLRAVPPCPAAADCGGCALQFLSPDRHAGVKSDWVAQAYRPFMHKTSKWIPAGPSPGLGCRRRARYRRGEDARGAFLGFRARASHSVVRHGSCPLV